MLNVLVQFLLPTIIGYKTLIQNRLMTTKYKMMRTFAGLAAGAGVFGLVGAAQAIQITTPQISILANGGDVSVTFVSASAADTDLMFLSPNTSTTLFNNQPNNQASTTVDLGNLAGLLTFGLNNLNISEIFFTGVASLNPDNAIHASVSKTTSGGVDTYAVGFEDLMASNSDWDYNDFVFTVTVNPVGTQLLSVPDVSSTLPLLGMSLMGLAALKRRFKK